MRLGRKLELSVAFGALFSSVSGAAPVAGSSPTTFASAPSSQYHPHSQSATLDGSNRVTACPDITGLAALTGPGGSNGPLQLTDALGRKFWRLSGNEWLTIQSTLSATQRNVTCLAIVRQHRGATTSAILGASAITTSMLEGTTFSSRFPTPRCFNRSHTVMDSNYNRIVIGSQLSLVGVASRTGVAGANTGCMLITNEQDHIVGQVGTNTAFSGGFIGKTSSGGQGLYDVYEIAIWNSGLNDATVRAARDAMLANWNIQPVTSQVVFVGDSITQGFSSMDSGECTSMQLSEPGLGHVPATCRVVNCGQGGWQVNDVVSERDGASTFSQFTLSGGAANNQIILHIGTNDMSAGGGTQTASQVYAEVVALLNSAVPSGYLQKGWKVFVQQNSAANDAYKMGQFPTLRGLYNNSQFLIDTLSDAGNTYDGLVRVIQSHLIEKGTGNTIFETQGDATNTTYYIDGLHPTAVGTQYWIDGADTPQYGIPAALAA